MKIEQIDIKKLIPAEYNPRKISKAEMDKLKKGITEFGMVDPIIINKDMTVIGGHQRLKALKSLKWQKAPCVVLDIQKDREKLLNLSLNRICGEWDEEKLMELISELADIPEEVALTGFEDEEINKILKKLDGFLEEKEEEIRAFKKTHILLSFPPEKLMYLQKHLEEIIKVEGVEYEQSSN